jgi:hypothetical protein
MLKAQVTRYQSILQTLFNHRVDCILVGGVAAALLGAPITTFDLDFVHSTVPENVARLLAALGDLDAFYRMQPELRRKPDASHLSSPGRQLLQSKFGLVDFLDAIGRGRTYGDLLEHTVQVQIGEVGIRVFDLPTQIAVKEEVGAEKDLAVLPVLRATLEEMRRR